MSFAFRFASILKLREYRKKVEEQQLGSLMNEGRTLAGKLEEWRNKRDQAGLDASDRTQLNLADVRTVYGYLHHCQEQVNETIRQVKENQQQLEEQRKKLREADIRADMLRKLEAREKKRFLEHQQHIEQQQLNELATQMFNRTQEQWT